jgi:hypothetical protein
VVAAGAAKDRIEPREGVRAALEAAPAAPRLDEHLLRHVLGLVRVVEQQARRPVDARAVRLGHRVKGVGVRVHPA